MTRKQPIMDWQAIKAEIHRRGMTLTALAERSGLHPTLCRQVSSRTNRKAQQIIADFIGQKPEDLWPDRYLNGKHRILDTTKFPPVASQKSGAVTDSRKVA